MKKILLVVLFFACSIATAQTFTVNGTTYNIVSGDLLTVANAYAKGYDIGNAAARGITCAPTSVSIDVREDANEGVQLGTYVSSRTTNIDATSINWTLIRFNGDVIDVTDDVSNNGDINFNFRAANHPLGGRLPPEDGSVQPGDMIRVVYVDDCGTYVDVYTVPTNAGAIRVPPMGMRPPKVRRPV